MISYKYLLDQVRTAYDCEKLCNRRLNELDAVLIFVHILIILYSFATGISYFVSGRTVLGVISGGAFGLSVVNIVIAIRRMIRRRKSAKSSLEFWEAEINSLEELINEDAESEMDIPGGSTGNVHG